jgi:phosphoribosyl 1,2-cyclic phosphodiesterase
MCEFVIRGTRGQRPTCGPNFDKYGGHTTCYSLTTGSGTILFDAGSGLSTVPVLLHGESVSLLFTHFHIDHLIGLPALHALAGEGARVRVLGDPHRDRDWRDALNTFMGKPFWPVSLDELHADLRMDNLPIDDDHLEIDGIHISWMAVPHPQQCLSYRVAMPKATVIIATDLEYEKGSVPDSFLRFCDGADFLIIDAQFTPQEYRNHKGWGHSSWEVGVEVASRAGVGTLVLTHHAATRTDSEIDEILATVRAHYPNTVAAHDNMCLTPSAGNDSTEAET